MKRFLRSLPRRVQVTNLAGIDQIAKPTLEITRKPISVLQKIGKFLLAHSLGIARKIFQPVLLDLEQARVSLVVR